MPPGSLKAADGDSVLVLVLPHHVSGHWLEVEPMIAQALKRGHSHWSALNIFEYLLKGEMLLWLSKRGDEIEACGVTQIINYPLSRVCSILVISGKVSENWLRFEADFTEYARKQYCTQMEGYGRRGWQRLAPEGWEPIQVVFRKKL